MDYSILRNEYLPTALQNKPRWMSCLVCTAGLLIVTLSAVCVGAFIGYTYCYMEHRTGFRSGDMTHHTHATKLKIIGMPSQYDDNDRKTINSVLFSSVLVSRLVEFGQNLKEDISQNFSKDMSFRKILEPNISEFM